MADKYESFAALAAGEAGGTAYRVNLLERPDSQVAIIAPHGGSIEVGTSELAALICGSEYSLFTFDGLKPRGHNRDLHITSHNFDHPACLALVARHSIVIGLHGCAGKSQLYVGGLDEALAALLTQRLSAAGFPVAATGHRYPGRNPLNICNRNARGRGAQLELTTDLREPAVRTLIAPVVRSAIASYEA
ncbi:MAG: hypothetical protein JWM63_1476 [Gammaproteobacteria bacterium]|jgi:phage replication-related protein YjqB (UPF0714/DUF867 family)|nr:hypothetical protein [Gammaproteobacteria bacterium]